MTENEYGTLLLVVDDSPSDAVAPLLARLDRTSGHGTGLRVHTYAEVARGIPPLSEDTLVILCFPHAFWDTGIEGRLPGPYGTARYAKALREHLLRTGEMLAAVSPGPVHYLNPPRSVALTRDKAAAQHLLDRCGVPVPERLTAPAPDDVLAELRRGGSLYVKAVCGSMGKGMTHLAPDRWQTNYHYDGKDLLRPVRPAGEADWERSEQWLFQDVAVGDRAFLDLLCRTPGFLFERRIGRPGDGPNRTEFRITVAGASVAAVEERRAPPQALTTRRAEGGHRHGDDPEHPRARAACDAALDAARALGLGYAVFDVVTDTDAAPYVVDTTACPATGTSPELWRRLLDLTAVRSLQHSTHLNS